MNCNFFLQYYCFYSILINLFHKYKKQYSTHFINLQRMCSTFSSFLFYYAPLFCSYNLESSTWDVVPINGGPLQRYGHSLALHKVNASNYHTLHNNASVRDLTVCNYNSEPVIYI